LRASADGADRIAQVEMAERPSSDSQELGARIRSAARQTRWLRFAVLAAAGLLLGYPLARALIFVVVHPADPLVYAWFAVRGLHAGDYGGLVFEFAIRFAVLAPISFLVFALPVAAGYRAWCRAGLRWRLAALPVEERRTILLPLLQGTSQPGEVRKLIAPLLRELPRTRGELAPALALDGTGEEPSPAAGVDGSASAALRAPGAAPPPAARTASTGSARATGRPSWWLEARGWLLPAAALAAILAVSGAASLRFRRLEEAQDRRERIHRAAAEGDLSLVRRLVEADPGRVNLRDRDGRTPLYDAAIQGEVKVAAYLLSHGADVNARDRARSTPLLVAIYEEPLAAPHTRIAAFLLAHGADPVARDRDGDTPLHVAVSEGESGVVELLLADGVAPGVRNRAGDTPLHIAVRDWPGRGAAARLLLARDPSLIWARDGKGKAPLDIAREQGCEPAVQVLERAARKSESPAAP
jgi:ankyrin repeat protein